MFMGILKLYLGHKFSTLSIAAIGNVHRGTSHERIDQAVHSQSRWQWGTRNIRRFFGDNIYIIQHKKINESTTVCSLTHSLSFIETRLTDKDWSDL